VIIYKSGIRLLIQEHVLLLQDETLPSQLTPTDGVLSDLPNNRFRNSYRFLPNHTRLLSNNNSDGLSSHGLYYATWTIAITISPIRLCASPDCLGRQRIVPLWRSCPRLCMQRFISFLNAGPIYNSLANKRKGSWPTCSGHEYQSPNFDRIPSDSDA